MCPKSSDRPTASPREDRLAKALRENLARRKGLARAKKARADDSPEPDPAAGAAASKGAGGEDASS